MAGDWDFGPVAGAPEMDKNSRQESDFVPRGRGVKVDDADGSSSKIQKRSGRKFAEGSAGFGASSTRPMYFVQGGRKGGSRAFQSMPVVWWSGLPEKFELGMQHAGGHRTRGVTTTCTIAEQRKRIAGSRMGGRQPGRSEGNLSSKISRSILILPVAKCLAKAENTKKGNLARVRPARKNRGNRLDIINQGTHECGMLPSDRRAGVPEK